MLTRRKLLQLGAAALALRPARAFPGVADRIFHSGTILTMNPEQPRAEALAVKDGQVLAVGSGALDTRGAATHLTSLQGATLLPGFVEPQVSLVGGGSRLEWLDLGTRAKLSSLHGYLERLRAVGQRLGVSQWLLAHNFDPTLSPDGLGFTRGDLDVVVPENPVVILGASGQRAYVNSEACRRAGIACPSGVAEGGELVALGRALPPLTTENAERLTLKVMQQAALVGCTTVTDMGVGSALGPLELKILHDLTSTGRAPVRVAAFLAGRLREQWKAIPGVAPGAGDDSLRLQGLKYYVDGSLQDRSARLRHPYLGTPERGQLRYDPGELQAELQVAAREGWGLSLQAEGDEGIEVALDAFPSGRGRIDHCSLAQPDQLARMARLGLSPSFLDGQVSYWGRALPRLLGPERAAQVCPLVGALSAGLRLSLQSDFPTTKISPLGCVQTAVNLQLPVEAALRAITLDAAYQCGLDHRVGSLEPGKLADLVVLERNPLESDPARLSKIRIVETWLAGQRM